MVSLDLEKYFDKKKKVFEDATVFDNSYCPLKPVERKEAAIILEKVADFMRLGVAEHLFIIGKHGSGKTLYGKYLIGEIKKVADLKKRKIMVEYKNCRDYSSSLNIIMSLCSTSYADSGLIMDSFFEWLKDDLILILDEVDELKDANFLLYQLSRISEIQEKTTKKIELIIISNKSEWDKDLDNAVRSSLNLTKIIFSDYSKTQIKEILKQRVELGLINKKIISEQIFNFIVEKTIRNNSDLRIAIKSLFLICKEIEKIGSDEFSENELDEIYEDAIKEVQSERIKRLDNTVFLILYSIGIAQNDAVRSIFENEYKQICRENHIKSLGYTRFNFYLKTLDDQNIIIMIKDKKERAIYHKARLSVNKNIIKEEYEKRRILFTKRYVH